jgi:hypothetical protein
MRKTETRGLKEHQLWNAIEVEILQSFNTPESVQDFLDQIPYNTELTCRSPRRVMRDKKANCMEGAFFAAASLEFMGFKPSVVYFYAVRDDGHAVTLFRRNGKFGSIAKSNYTGLRYRSPVFKSVRELVISYFDHHFNTRGELTMRSYTQPLYLKNALFPEWQIREDDLFDISDHFDRLRAFTIITPYEARSLRLVDEKSLKAGLLGADKKGLYKI